MSLGEPAASQRTVSLADSVGGEHHRPGLHADAEEALSHALVLLSELSRFVTVHALEHRHPRARLLVERAGGDEVSLLLHPAQECDVQAKRGSAKTPSP